MVSYPKHLIVIKWWVGDHCCTIRRRLQQVRKQKVRGQWHHDWLLGWNRGISTCRLVCAHLISTLVVASCDGFLDCGSVVQLLPSFRSPLGIMSVSSLVMLAVLFVFFDRNSISLPLISATATSGSKSPMCFPVCTVGVTAKVPSFLGCDQGRHLATIA